MEFKEVIKAHNRMCRTYINQNNCGKCQLSSYYDVCYGVPFKYTEEYEELIKEWLNNNPTITQKDIFIENHSDKPWQKYLDFCGHVQCDRNIPCLTCLWWNEEVNQKEE